MKIIENLNENSKEIWRDVVGYEGLYQVSNLGRVKSLERYVKNSKNGFSLKRERLLTLTKDNKGYFRAKLSKDGTSKPYRVHRLVAVAFIPNKSNLLEVDHIDANRTNNSVSNLRWVNHRQNINNPNGCGFGERHYRARKIINLDTKQIFSTIEEAGAMFNASGSNIRAAILNGWKCAKCRWGYYEG